MVRVVHGVAGSALGTPGARGWNAGMKVNTFESEFR